MISNRLMILSIIEKQEIRGILFLSHSFFAFSQRFSDGLIWKLLPIRRENIYRLFSPTSAGYSISIVNIHFSGHQHLPSYPQRPQLPPPPPPSHRKPSKFVTIDFDWKRKDLVYRASVGYHRSKHNHHHHHQKKSIYQRNHKRRRRLSAYDTHEYIVIGNSKIKDVFYCYSDCTSAKRGGELGQFGRKQMQKSFEKEAYALKVTDK